MSDMRTLWSCRLNELPIHSRIPSAIKLRSTEVAMGALIRRALMAGVLVLGLAVVLHPPLLRPDR